MAQIITKGRFLKVEEKVNGQIHGVWHEFRTPKFTKERDLEIEEFTPVLLKKLAVLIQEAHERN